MPDTLDAGRTSFVLTNDGHEAHFLLVVKLAEGVTLEQALRREDDADDRGRLETGLAAPGGEDDEVITFDLEPGNYGARVLRPRTRRHAARLHGHAEGVHGQLTGPE